MRISQLVELMEEIAEDHGDIKVQGITGVQVGQIDDERHLVLVDPDSE